jgi:hypothetical protein
LTAEAIDRAMVKMIGKDWCISKVEIWIKKFKDEGYISEEATESDEELRALIVGSIKLDGIQQ